MKPTSVVAVALISALTISGGVAKADFKSTAAKVEDDLQEQTRSAYLQNVHAYNSELMFMAKNYAIRELGSICKLSSVVDTDGRISLLNLSTSNGWECESHPTEVNLMECANARINKVARVFFNYP